MTWPCMPAPTMSTFIDAPFLPLRAARRASVPTARVTRSRRRSPRRHVESTIARRRGVSPARPGPGEAWSASSTRIRLKERTSPGVNHRSTAPIGTSSGRSTSQVSPSVTSVAPPLARTFRSQLVRFPYTSAMAKPSSVGTGLTGVSYARPETRPTWRTIPAYAPGVPAVRIWDLLSQVLLSQMTAPRTIGFLDRMPKKKVPPSSPMTRTMAPTIDASCAGTWRCLLVASWSIPRYSVSALRAAHDIHTL